MEITKEIVEQALESLLNDCLASENQEYSFKVLDTNLNTGKFTVEFDIVIIEEDNFIGFHSY